VFSNARQNSKTNDKVVSTTITKIQHFLKLHEPVIPVETEKINFMVGRNDNGGS
jgi:hypothetical protein